MLSAAAVVAFAPAIAAPPSAEAAGLTGPDTNTVFEFPASSVGESSDALPVPAGPSPDATGEAVLPVAEPARKTGRLKLGGAIRARYDLRFNDTGATRARRTSSHLSFDTLLLTADYDSSVVFGAAQYRFYGGSFIYGRANGYDNYPGEVSFPVYAYVGAKLNEKQKVTVGVQSVPFDERWWGTAFFNSLGFVYGMEEVYNAGVTFSHKDAHLSLDAGYFPTTAPSAFGISDDSARFSVNFVKGDSYVPDGSRNAERDMFVGRAQYHFDLPGKSTLTLTGSAWLSTIHNFDTRENGYRRSYALSASGDSGPWHAKVLAARQVIEPRNGGRNDLITVGDYDSSYNIAAKGTLAFGEAGRKIETGSLPLSLSLYANYARFFKDAPGFADTERLTLGAFWSDKATNRIRIWSDLMIGRNDPYVGAGQFLSGAGPGGDDRFKASLIILMGYYF